MNLHNIAGPIVSAINPSVKAQWQRSAGFTQDASYKRVAAYETAEVITAQVQPLAWKDLQQISGLNLNGDKKIIYASSSMAGVSRPDIRGGDLITLPDSTVWLVVQQLEDFYATSGWCKVACVRQNA